MATTPAPTPIPTPSPTISTPPITIHSLSSSSSSSSSSSPTDIPQIQSLFRTYALSLGIDLSYQDFATELATLPGKYAESQGGALFLARTSKVPPNDTNDPHDTNNPQSYLGCVAVRALPLSLPFSSASSSNKTSRACEMKRLYVTPQARSTGLGRLLARAAITDARRRGYDAMYLDTLPSMTSAQKLYRSLGFEETEAYYETPVEGTVFMRLDLSKWEGISSG